MPSVLTNIKNYSKDTISYGIGYGLQKFISFLLLPLYTRVLTPSDYGIIDTITAGLLLFSIILDAGIINAANLYFYKAETEEEKGKLLFTTFILRLLSTIPSFILSLFSKQISLLLFNSPQYTWVVFVSCMIIPVSMLNEEQIWIFRYFRKPWNYNLSTIIKTTGNFLFGLLLVVFLKKGILGVQFATLLSSLIVIIYSFTTFTRKKYVYKFSKEWAKKLLKFGAPFIFSLSISWVFTSSDRYFLLHYQNTTEIGLYSIGYTFARPLSLVNVAFSMSFWPYFMSMWETEKDVDKSMTKQTAAKIWHLYLITACSLGLFLSIFATTVIPFITTQQYLTGALVVPFLIFSGIIRASTDMNSPGISLKEKSIHYAWLTFVTACVSVGCNLIFIPRLSFLGASLSNLISNLIYFILAVWVSQKYFPYDLKILKVAIYFLACLLIASFFPVGELKFNFHSTLILKCFLFILGLILPFLLKLITISDTQIIVQKIKSKVKNVRN